MGPTRAGERAERTVARGKRSATRRRERWMAELSFKVPQMGDGAGVKAITTELRRIEGVSGVEIDLHTKWVVIIGERIDSAAIRRAVSAAGYEAEL